MRAPCAAVAFLTRIPVPGADVGSADLARAVSWFPVVGLGLGAVVGLLTWGGGLALPPLVAAVLAVGAGLLLTGALHEDGLADMFDGLGGARSRERVLEVMQDSRLGTFGAAALFVTLAGRVGALAALPGLTPLLVAPAAGAIGRGAAVAVMGVARPARPHGLGADHLRSLPRWRVAAGVLTALVLATALVGVAVVPAAVAATAATAVTARWAVGRLGGVTGDVLGAVAVLAELAVLVVLSAPAIRAWLPW